MQVIENKTAILFQAAAQCGAILAGATEDEELALKRFGMHMGTAFQLIDDVSGLRRRQRVTGQEYWR